eukprot:630287-Rhodomonas_salina.3
MQPPLADRSKIRAETPMKAELSTDQITDSHIAAIASVVVVPGAKPALGRSRKQGRVRGDGVEGDDVEGHEVVM